MRGHPVATAFHVDPLVNDLLRLRCEGHTIAYCATALGLSESRVGSLLRRVAKEYADDREAMVAKQREQLQYLWRRTLAPWTKDDDSPLPEKVTQTLLRILDREAKLLGLDAPTRVEAAHSFDTAADADLLAEARRLGIDATAIAALNAANPPISVELVEDADAGPVGGAADPGDSDSLAAAD